MSIHKHNEAFAVQSQQDRLDSYEVYSPAHYSKSDLNLVNGEYLDDESEDGDERTIMMGEILDIVDAVVSDTDDPTQPVITFRVLVLGGLFGLVLAVCNTVFSFKTNFFGISPYFVLLLSYPLGNFMYWSLSPRIYTLPYFKTQFTLNPGPFNFKENAMIYVIVRTAAAPAYALYNIVSQKYYLNQSLNIGWCIAFAIVTQLSGYGVAGLCRKVLVRPAAMLWPGTLTVIATLRALHEHHSTESKDNENKDDDTASRATNDAPSTEKGKWMSKRVFLLICMSGMFAYQFLPGFVAPMLSAVSVLCYTGTFNQRLHMLGSARQGFGILSLSFDWSIIGQLGPIRSPLWAMLNQYAGLLFFVWIVAPLLWVNNAFGADQILGSDSHDGLAGRGRFTLAQAVNSPALFNSAGREISALQLVYKANHSLVLNQTAYEMNQPIRITTLYAVQYFGIFVAFTSTFMHAFLWYRKDIGQRFKFAVQDLDTKDIHAQMMDRYLDVPDSWYGILLCTSTIGALTVCTWGGFDLEWWGVLLSIAVSVVCILPLGIVEAISGQRVATNVEAELLYGFIAPGQLTHLMTFKTLTYMGVNEALAFLEDLKLSHFVKIPPRTMFWAQIISTVLCAVVNVIVGCFISERLNVGSTTVMPTEGWTAYNYQIFLSAGTIWGAIGSTNFFGPSSPYFPCLAGFAVGLVAPIIPYALHALFPNSLWHLVNIPIIAMFHSQIGALRSDLVTPLLVAFTVNFVVKRVNFEWWKRYAFVMSSAFDVGAACALLVMLAIVTIFPRIKMPYHALNRFDIEGCLPKEVLACREYGKC
ncbi:hypothetical protein HDU77_003872 [Chytriomyces hyalinus]|nr:hypothetical protein HDU77_003872 [Chytriomyces hyalinus]